MLPIATAALTGTNPINTRLESCFFVLPVSRSVAAAHQSCAMIAMPLSFIVVLPFMLAGCALCKHWQCHSVSLVTTADDQS